VKGTIRARVEIAVVLAALAIAASGAAASECRAPSPLSRTDPILQTQLSQALRSAGLEGPLRQRKLAVSLVDLTAPGETFYAGVNDDHMLYAASLPKIGILLAVLQGVNDGAIAWTPEFSWRLTKMITISDNAFATWGARLVGLRGIAEVLLDPRYCLYEPGVGGLWVGRAFEKGGDSLRDPLKGISHAATARQTARFYAMLEAGQLVSPYWSEWMLAHMGPPEYVHKFYFALGNRPGVEFIARKSGTWQNFHSDTALVVNGSRRYILVALADHTEGEVMLQRIAEVADGIIESGEHRTFGARP
jgi:beta-lactamase class A